MGNLSLVLGTTYNPSLDPINVFSIAAVCVVGLLTMLCSWPMPTVVRRYALLASPALLLALSAVTEGSPVLYTWYHGRSFPDLADFTAATLLLAFGFGISLMNIREGTLHYRVNGSLFSLVFGSYIVLMVSMLISGLTVQLLWPPFLITALFIPGWLMVAKRLSRRSLRNWRRRHNLCMDCGYDLRGSADRPACPECGAGIVVLETAGP